MNDLKKSLMVIAQEVLDLEKALLEAGGEITDEIGQKLQVKELELPQKVDNYAHVLKRLDITADHFKAQADFFLKVARGIEKAHERLKQNIKSAMEIMGTSEIGGHDFKIKMVRYKSSVVIEDESKLDGKFLITLTSTKPDKILIAKELELGGSVSGARLEGNASLRIFPNKS